MTATADLVMAQRADWHVDLSDALTSRLAPRSPAPAPQSPTLAGRCCDCGCPCPCGCYDCGCCPTLPAVAIENGQS